jgi:hypothetical protein
LDVGRKKVSGAEADRIVERALEQKKTLDEFEAVDLFITAHIDGKRAEEIVAGCVERLGLRRRTYSVTVERWEISRSKSSSSRRSASAT